MGTVKGSIRQVVLLFVLGYCVGLGGCVAIPAGNKVLTTQEVSREHKADEQLRTSEVKIVQGPETGQVSAELIGEFDVHEYDEVLVQQKVRRCAVVIGFWPYAGTAMYGNRKLKHADVEGLAVVFVPMLIVAQVVCPFMEFGFDWQQNSPTDIVALFYILGWAKTANVEEDDLARLEKRKDAEIGSIRADTALHGTLRDQRISECESRYAKEREQIASQYTVNLRQQENVKTEQKTHAISQAEVALRVPTLGFTCSRKTDAAGRVTFDLSRLPILSQKPLEAELAAIQTGSQPAPLRVTLPSQTLGLALADELLREDCPWDKVYLDGETVKFGRTKPSLAPFAETAVKVGAQDSDAADTLPVTITVKNSGRGALCRLVGQTRCPEVSGLANRLLVFGNVEAGATVRRSISLPVVDLDRGRKYNVEVAFHEANQNQPQPLLIAIDGASVRRPDFGWTCEIVDNSSRSQTAVGNADGVIQRGEAFDLVVTVKNIGKAKATGTRIKLDLSTDPSLTLYGSGEQDLGDIAPEGFKTARFNVSVKPWSTLTKLDANVSLSETSFREKAERRIELPFDVRVAQQPMVVDRNYYVAVAEAVLRSGAAENAAEYGRAPQSTMLHAVGELPEWVLVELPVEEKGERRAERVWVARNDVTTTSPSTGGAAKPVVITRFGNLPPTIAFIEPAEAMTTAEDRWRITVSVVADGKLADVVLEAGPAPDKLREIRRLGVAEGERAAERVLRETVELGMGTNLLRVTAKDERGQTASRSLTITREDRADTASLALVIGVEECRRMGKVPGCRADAKAVAEAIQRVRHLAPGRVLLMADNLDKADDPTAGAMEDNIKELAKVGEGGLAFFYFSGHGIARGENLLLVPRDKKDDGIALQDVVEAMAASKARDKVIVIDACRSTAEDKAVGGLAADLKARQNIAIFLSCSMGEYSYPDADGTQSVYTKLFIRALEEALLDRTKPVTTQALGEWIRKEIAKRSGTERKQTPQLLLAADQDVILVPAGR